MAKFRNKNVTFRAKNNCHKISHKSLGIPNPTPPYLGNIPKKTIFLVLPLTITSGVMQYLKHWLPLT